MNFEVITLAEAQKWGAVLESFPREVRDVYFYPDYYRSWQSIYPGSALCVHAKIGSHEVLYPFFKTEITGYDLDGRYYDISSAYGYGGAITSAPITDEKTKHTFDGVFSHWCKTEKVIAEFIREYPGMSFRNTQSTCRVWVRTNVFVDTSPSESKIWHGLPESTQRNVRIAQRNSFTFRIDEDLSTICEFSKLYSHTAQTKGFEPFYHFPDTYFLDVKRYLSGQSVIINVLEGDQIIASALCFFSGDKFTYHLGASHSSKLHLRPNDLLFWTMITEAKRRGYRWLHLGGGMSTRSDDSLFRFKNKFGSHRTPVYVGSCIHNKAIYHELCHQWGLLHPTLVERKSHYCLKYRERS